MTRPIYPFAEAVTTVMLGTESTPATAVCISAAVRVDHVVRKMPPVDLVWVVRRTVELVTGPVRDGMQQRILADLAKDPARSSGSVMAVMVAVLEFANADDEYRPVAADTIADVWPRAVERMAV